MKLIKKYQNPDGKITSNLGISLPEVTITPDDTDYQLMHKGLMLIPNKKLRKDIATAYLSAEADAKDANTLYNNLLDIYKESGAPAILTLWYGNLSHAGFPEDNTIYLRGPGHFMEELAHKYQDTHPKHWGTWVYQGYNVPGSTENIAHSTISPIMTNIIHHAKSGQAALMLNNTINKVRTNSETEKAALKQYLGKSESSSKVLKGARKSRMYGIDTEFDWKHLQK